MDRPRNLSGGTPAIELPGLRFALGEDIDMLRATVRGFAQAEIAPRAAEIDRSNQFPSDLWRKMGALGLLGVTVEEAYGGTMMGYAAHIVAMEEISRASASVGLSYGAHSNLCVNQIRRNGTETQKRKYLPKLVAGDWTGALAMSEPGSGSDVVSMKTRAEYRKGKFVVNGSKMWITIPGLRGAGGKHTVGGGTRGKGLDVGPRLRARGARRRAPRHYAGVHGCGRPVPP